MMNREKDTHTSTRCDKREEKDIKVQGQGSGGRRRNEEEPEIVGRKRGKSIE